MLRTLLNPLAILMSISTATGVVLHDIHADSAVSAAFSTPAIGAHYDGVRNLNLGGETHTHVERISLNHISPLIFGHNPSIHPRENEGKKHLMQKRVMRGHHAFDNYSLPVV